MTIGVRAEVVRGLAAVSKSALLVVGVPLSLARLWYLAPSDPRPLAGRSLFSVAGGVHDVLVVVAALWLWASISLVREIVAAFGHAPAESTGRWSRRWAGAIAGLFLALGASATAGIAREIPIGASTTTAVAATSVAPMSYAPAAVLPPMSPVATVRQGECLADLAARALGDPGRWPEIARVNNGRLQGDGTRFVDANLLRAGWCLELPDRPPAGAADGSRAAAARRQLAEIALLGLGTLVTAGVARRAGALRALAESGRAPGTVFDRPPAAMAGLAAALEPFGDSSLLEWVEAALRLIATASSPRLPEVRLVRAGPAGVELLISEGDGSPPWPMSTADGGRWWVLDASDLGEPRSLAPDKGRSVPWLVPVGEDADAVYLVALGPGRRLVIDADTDATMIGVLAGLRTLPWASELGVELIGLPAPPAEERCFQIFASSPAALLQLARRGAPTPRRDLRPQWRAEPLVMVRGTGPNCSEEILEAVGAIAGIVTDAGAGTERLVVGTDGTATLEPYGIVLSPPMPSGEQVELLDRLFATAADTTPLPRLRPRDAPTGPVTALVAVRLLAAPTAVDGLEAPAARDRDRIEELLTYLVLHDRRCPFGQISRALFGREPADGAARRLTHLLAATRAVLPRDPDGREWLAVEHDGTVTLGPAVTDDWRAFRRAIDEASAGDPVDAVAAISSAFTMVGERGAFTPGGSYPWIDAEGIGTEIRASLIDAAHHLTSLAFAIDDLELAAHAVARALSVDPISEIAVRDAMVLADRRGDLTGVEKVFRSLELALEELAAAEPSAETRALHRALVEVE